MIMIDYFIMSKVICCSELVKANHIQIGIVCMDRYGQTLTEVILVFGILILLFL